MDPAAEGAFESVEAIHFGFYKDEEVKKVSFKKITNPELLDGLGRPTSGGLYDATLGPLDDWSICKTCGQISSLCPGHFGHIELVSAVYNPMLFGMLYNLLQRTCLMCHHFRADPSQVRRCASNLARIIDGDVVKEENMDDTMMDGHYDAGKCQTPKEWTSFQYSAVMSELNNFLRQRHKDCRNCKARNPTISKPTFGWFHMSGVTSGIRANIIRGCKLEMPASDCDVQESCTAFDNKSQPPGEYFKQKTFLTGTLFPSEVMFIMEKLWEKEANLCSLIAHMQKGMNDGFVEIGSWSMFFLKRILVPPIKFRMPAKAGESVMVHPQTVLLGKVLEANISLGHAHMSLGNTHLNNAGNLAVVKQWMSLQFSINVLFDSKTAMGQAQKDGITGICQLLEKKEGIFRQKMMGKRVNFACRSVISPDPYLSVNEIGIPPYFAVRLTYPERVTKWNVIELRDIVVNGPDVHPGATHYVDKVATRKLPACKRTRVLTSRKLPSSRGVAARPGKTCDDAFEGKIVYRHLRDGDIVLVNRQPTLHKPSIMAHVVRVLKGEKTLRMHYANCSTYNADFDGDEINVHFPQDEISRAEAYNIVNANDQYIIPTRGDAGRGLIQDHIVSAVLLTKTDTFLSRDEFNQLLYSSGVSSTGPLHFSWSLGSKKVQVVDHESILESVPPAIWKPKPLWTGKQVVTAVLNHITRGLRPFTLEREGKIPREYFGSGRQSRKKMSPADHTLLVYKNELLRGVIDKAQFGNYGLVHTVHELYGSTAAGNLLSVFSRLFTVFLQIHGFTCGIDDLLIIPEEDAKRWKHLECAEALGEKVHRQFIGLQSDKISEGRDLKWEIEKAVRSHGEMATACLDRLMLSELNEMTSGINKDLLNKGLVKRFPNNCVSLMTAAGAKGSTVNFSQISSFLGQQELEGKRVPRMISGKTLPCFPPWDHSSRAGGFISDRFLSGLRPQEYYFHCMAGREGLVDTAVKTSRSGYLQRCLVKNLECLKVAYDRTVRDVDGSIVQFCYGEDGVDVTQSSFLNQYKALIVNRDVLREKYGMKLDCDNVSSDIKGLPFIENLSRGKLKKHFLHQLRCNSLIDIPSDQQEDLFNLVKHKYFFSLAQPGEPVGVLAAQSVGEPTTQMTLNTFHLAGRGEMNVTLGIPRLQEILMTATADIRTPIMECPLKEEKTQEDGKRLSAQLNRITVADLIESMKIVIVPVARHKSEICTLYKLKVKLYDAKRFPPHSGISLKLCAKVLKVEYMRELEDAIQNHLQMLSRISGIKNYASDRLPETSTDDSHQISGDAGPADDTDDDTEKMRLQATDEVDYDSDSCMETQEDETSVGGDASVDDVVGGKGGRKLRRKETDRAVFVEARGVNFEAHFRLADEPHILLGQVAQRAAKKVHVKKQGSISRCEVVERDHGRLGNRWVMQAGGVDFRMFWKLQDDVDVRLAYSNSVHAVLEAYGVEAARSTIIREVQSVFSIYGTSVDFRHLSVIADYMTHAGGFRPMNRSGAIAECVSPFSRISFETASKFLAQAALHGDADTLRSPAARICLGLPVQLGTGCFDLMHQLRP